MKTNRVVLAAMAAVLVAACSGDPESPAEPVADEDTSPPTTQPDAATEPATTADATGEPTATDPTTSAEDDEAANAEPISLDESIRHPNGAVLTLSSITFTDTTVEVEMEIRNGHTERIELPIGGLLGSRLRLVDDQNHTYNFVVPEGEGDNIEVSPGEAVSGTFVFLGPLAGEASSLSLAWGVREPGDYALDEESDGTIFPGFLVRELPVAP